jgi:hypothetical protein
MRLPISSEPTGSCSGPIIRFSRRPPDIFATVADAFPQNQAVLAAVANQNAVSLFDLPLR